VSTALEQARNLLAADGIGHRVTRRAAAERTDRLVEPPERLDPEATIDLALDTLDRIAAEIAL
jgi:hypothetical protein